MYKIYKIIDNTNDNIYIGITKQKYLSRRISKHRHDFKRGHYCSSQIILKNKDYKIELIEKTDDKTRERYWIENINCVNEVIPGRTRKINYKSYQISWGGRIDRNNNSLLKIDPNLFT